MWDSISPPWQATMELVWEAYCDNCLPTEPCPMCLGTFYMSGLRTLYYASRDPYAGSVNLLGKTPYLSVKTIQVVGPCSSMLETIIMALYVEKELRDLNGNGQGHVVFEAWRQVVPQGVTLGGTLFQTGKLHHMREAGFSVAEVIEVLANQVQ